MKERVQRFLQKHEMIRPGERVAVALSGGADSVCLLLLLRELREELGFELEALHVNHRLRGTAADVDEAFVRALCGELSVPLEVRHVDVAALAKERGVGIEEAGRLARRALYATRPVVALAHHLGDQAETFLFRAARGSALSGLAGIRPVERLDAADAESTVLVRPLLGVEREEIEEYLTARGQAWREDETNSDEAYTRNAIRHSVLPALREKANSGTIRHLAEAAESIAAADAFLREEAAGRSEGLVRVVPSLDGDEPKDEIVVFDEVLALPEVLQGYILLDALQRAAGTRRDIGRLHLEQLRELFSLPTGKRLPLPHALVAVRERDKIRIV